MAEIAASMVMDLRQRTGLGMMECKKALTEAAGDLAKAEELLRIRSGAKASKAAGRIAAEGVIGLYVAPDAKTAAMVEVNCETDFVAKNDDFRAFAAEIAQIVARENPPDLSALGAKSLASGETIEARRAVLVQKIGENMSIRRFTRKSAAGRLASYVHGNRIGVLVDLTGGQDTLGKDLAMHVAASKPMAVSRNRCPPMSWPRSGRLPLRAPPIRASPRTSSKRWWRAPSRNFSPKSPCWRSRSSRATARRRSGSSSRRRARPSTTSSSSSWAKASRRRRTISRPKWPR